MNGERPNGGERRERRQMKSSRCCDKHRSRIVTAAAREREMRAVTRNRLLPSSDFRSNSGLDKVGQKVELNMSPVPNSVASLMFSSIKSCTFSRVSVIHDNTTY